MPSEITQLTAALGFFKDWTNYLLVTTVAALGWVSSQKHDVLGLWAKRVCVFAFAGSIAFAIFTLALIPLIAELVHTAKQPSIYSIDARFYLWPWEGRLMSLRLKHVCWLQHLLFLVGIGAYAVGALRAPEKRGIDVD